MDQNFQTSFIPKKPIIETRTTSTRPISFVTIISLFIFFIAFAVSLGLFFYKQILTSNLAKMDASLNLSKSRFEPDKIKQLQVLDKRLNAAKEILSKHMTTYPVFEVLQAITMKTVRYTKFSYNIDTATDAKILVTINGQADGYRSIALQSQLFTTKAKNFIDPVFFNLALDDKGNVSFSLEFSVVPNFVNYKQLLASQASTSVSIPPASTDTTTSGNTQTPPITTPPIQ